jgi:hypothetical protein
LLLLPIRIRIIQYLTTYSPLRISIINIRSSITDSHTPTFLLHLLLLDIKLKVYLHLHLLTKIHIDTTTHYKQGRSILRA